MRSFRRITAYLLLACLCSSAAAMPKTSFRAAKIFSPKPLAVKTPSNNNLINGGYPPPVEGRMIAYGRYTETDILAEERKVSDGIEKSRIRYVVTADFQFSQKVKIYTDSEGEHIDTIEDPQKAVSGTMQGKESMRELSPNGDSMIVNGSESGIVNKNSTVSVAHKYGGWSLGFGGFYDLKEAKCAGQIKTRNEITPHNACLHSGNENGGTYDPEMSASPDIPSPSADEDPNITIERDGLKNRTFGFAWYGTKTTKQKTGAYKITFSGASEDPSAEKQTREDSTEEKKVTRTHSATLNLTATIIPGPALPPGTMEIEPEKAADYDNWMPVPMADDDEKIAGLYGDSATLAFKVSFKPKDPKKPAPAAPMSFYLQDVSRHKGRCGNEPNNADDDDKPDLRFAKNQPGGVRVEPNDPQHAFIADDVTEAIVYVEATDAGAYGKLVARSDELGAVAVYKKTGANFVPIPRDDNNNHVADAWEKTKQNDIFAKNYPANWDAEDTPQVHNTGDGLTLYEEYRGFVIEVPVNDKERIRTWQRFSSVRKKLFVNLTGADKELFRQGALSFQKASLIQVFFIASGDDLKLDENHNPRVQKADSEKKIPAITYPELPPRWLNFNSDTDDGKDFGERQYAVNITNWELPIEPTVHARTPAIQGVGDYESAPPELTQAVYVFRGNNESIVKNFADREFPKNHPEKIDKTWYPIRDKIQQTRGINIDFKQVGDYIRANQPELVNRAIIFSVMHELSHATGMFHHTVRDYILHNTPTNASSGDSDCPMFYWDTDETAEFQLLFYSGNWNPAETAPSGKNWKYDNDKDCLQSCRLHKDKSK